MALSNFRRSAATETKRKGGGKGFRGNWRDKLYLEQDNPTPFLFQNQQYADPQPDQSLVEFGPDGQPVARMLEYFKFRKHRRKVLGYGGKERFLDDPCSAGWNPHNQAPCVGCYMQDQGDPSFGKKASDAYAAGIIHLVPYHRIPLIDPNKGAIMKIDNSGPVLTDVECEGKNCNYCRVLQGQNPVLQQGEFWGNTRREEIQTVFGSRRYLEFGRNHLEDLQNWDKGMGDRCSGPAFARDMQGNFIRDAQGNAIPTIGKCGTNLSIDGYACPHCNTVLIDVSVDTRELKELERIAMTEKYPCHKCGRPVLLQELTSCDVCNGNVATISTLFGSDTVLLGMKQGEQKNSHLVLKDYYTLSEFEARLDPAIRALYAGKTLKQRIEELDQPFDFDELYKAKPLADQCKRYQLTPGANGMPILQGQGAPPAYGSQPQPGYQQQPPAPGFYGQPPAAPQPGYPQPGPQYPQGQTAPPAYQPYPQAHGPGPAPFQAPAKPNFGQ
jgi:hypothetical protein